MKTYGLIIALAAALALPAMAQSAAAANEKEGVALTVYNGGYAVVREIRSLDIGQGGVVLFKDVAQKIDATTVHFKSLSDPGTKLLEQNYQFDLVSADKLLQKYIEKEIEIVAGKGAKGETTKYAGTLMSFDGAQIVLKEGNGNLVMIQRADNVRDIRFKSLPEGLLTKPTLVWLVDTDKPGKQLAEVTYQTYGTTWHAEYVMVLDGDDATADLTGWVSVQNNSGKTYTDARLKFIAGDVRRVAGPQPMVEYERAAGLAKSPAAAPMAEKAFFEYHMYTLPRPSTVADNEIKQLEMFAPVASMKVQKKYLYAPMQQFRWYGGINTERSYGITSDKKVQVFIEFKNSKDNKLGIPLPAGKVRVYKNDPDDKAMEFIGEEQIDHTPKDENLSLQIGNAFDVVGERKQTDYKIETGRKWMLESFEIKIRNHKKEAIVVRVKEPFYRGNNSKITANSHPEQFKQLDAFNGAWDLPIPAEQGEGKPGEVTLTYTVEYTW